MGDLPSADADRPPEHQPGDIGVLTRWELFGGLWRVLGRTDRDVTVSLCRCDGVEEERLVSSDPALIEWLAGRSSSAP